MRLRVTLSIGMEDLDQHKKELTGMVEKVENEHSDDTTWQAVSGHCCSLIQHIDVVLNT